MPRDGVIVRLELPKKTSVRLDDETVAALDFLSFQFGLNQTDSLALAIRHMKATLERGDAVYLTPRPGPDAPTSGPSGPAARPLQVVEKRTAGRRRRRGAS